MKLQHLTRLCVFVLLLTGHKAMSQTKFIHPGILHTNADFVRMKQVIANKELPGYYCFQLLEASSTAQSTYKMKGPYKYLSSQAEYGKTGGNISYDFCAAFQNAVMWKLTGDKEHAEKAKEIILAYADNLQEIPDVQDAALSTGNAWVVAYVGELLKYGYKPLKKAELRKIEKLLTDVFVPTMKTTFYNRPPYTNGNWGAYITNAYMAIAIFLDNREMYDFAKNFYLNANDNGSVKNYIDDVTGQCQESGRDQGHPMFGIGNMATICEMAYKQGDDLYSAYNNRLLKGYEYIAKYNLGYDDVPFRQWKDITGKYGKWSVISDKDRGRFAPIFEIVYNHFVGRKKLAMPYTKEVLDKTRPEAERKGSIGNPGFGALLFHD